ncbi:hypothetical protein Scep_022687 [Stephania cephalantha]|uniref:Fe2OG dioxygenase domain-containing protein n=1 Tax=Stephania cephalantha TaxID=152367 RepID=A0AAP0FB59_9MAGN
MKDSICEYLNLVMREGEGKKRNRNPRFQLGLLGWRVVRFVGARVRCFESFDVLYMWHVSKSRYANQRLRLNPNTDHKPDCYDDLQLEFNPSLYSSLERYLPPSMLGVSRDAKAQYMRDILAKYLPEGERTRPLHRELYDMHPTSFFVPSFLKAVTANTEESFRSIIAEPSPGVYTFEMLQPHFCELLLSEVENFERWVQEVKLRIMRPNTMNKFGAVLDDFGLEAMLDKLMDDFIRPISRVFFPEVGGATLDSHHGFVVEYGKDRDVDLGRCLSLLWMVWGKRNKRIFVEKLMRAFQIWENLWEFLVTSGRWGNLPWGFVEKVERYLTLNRFTSVGFHVDDSEVTLNVCLGKQFSGGQLFFRGIRCDKHVNTETQPEEFLEYSHVPGQAALHRGRHRHGARATTSGHRINLLLWCRSSAFRELKKYQKDFSSWCGECQREKKERQRQSVAATKLELLRREGESMT